MSLTYNIGLSSGDFIDYMYSASTNSQSQIDSVANSALSRGIDLYQKGEYAGAVVQFNQSLALSPNSNYSTKALIYLAQAYQNQGKSSEAIKTYQRAITANPTDDTLHLSLGDLYYKTGKDTEAQQEYFKAVQFNPISPVNRYSLGQAYLASGQFKEAQAQYAQVTQLAPNSPTGYFGLGQVNRKLGKYTDALYQLNAAVKNDRTFANAYLEMGYTYTDMGKANEANNQLAALRGLGADNQIVALQKYINQNTAPKIVVGTNSDGNVKMYSGPGTAVSDLDSSLATPWATKAFTMTFAFSKDMDIISVESLANWQISRQSGGHISDDYNFGMPVLTTEISLPTQPTQVVYNPSDRIATVTFQLQQNEGNNGTIDPTHIAFKFSGLDSYRKTMDPKADEFSLSTFVV